MSGPKNPRPTRNPKAPRDSKPGAPFAGRESKPNPQNPGNSGSSGPGAQISRRAADRLRAGHVWVYASDIESLSLPESGLPESGLAESDSGVSPALLPVADSRGLLLGTALYSPASQIALRLVSREAIDELAWLDLLAARWGRAMEPRLPYLAGEDRKSD